MANLNIEPGADSFDELISKTEHGVLMKTNTSWSIDDSRNKFQFSCEYGQLIRMGTRGGRQESFLSRGLLEILNNL